MQNRRSSAAGSAQKVTTLFAASGSIFRMHASGSGSVKSHAPRSSRLKSARSAGPFTRLSTSVQVNFGGNLAWFADLIVTTDIAFGGDSGSLVLDEVDRSAIGLVMSAAEEEGSTMVCPIEAVQDALDVRVSDKVWSP